MSEHKHIWHPMVQTACACGSVGDRMLLQEAVYRLDRDAQRGAQDAVSGPSEAKHGAEGGAGD